METGLDLGTFEVYCFLMISLIIAQGVSNPKKTMILITVLIINITL